MRSPLRTSTGKAEPIAVMLRHTKAGDIGRVAHRTMPRHQDVPLPCQALSDAGYSYRKIVEREQRLAILRQALDPLGYFAPYFSAKTLIVASAAVRCEHDGQRFRVDQRSTATAAYSAPGGVI